MNRPKTRRRGKQPCMWSALSLSAVAATFLWVAGCAKPYAVRATSYDIKLRLDPTRHTLAGRATLALQSLEPRAAEQSPSGRFNVAFELHEDLQVSDVSAHGAKVVRVKSKRPSGGHAGVAPPRTHVVTLDHAEPDVSLTVAYEGTLQQDVAAGEQRGQIHNFAASAHIASEGTYLEPGGHWYPSPIIENAGEIDPALLLANWQVEVELSRAAPTAEAAVYELVATGIPVEPPAEPDRRIASVYRWISPHRLIGFTITGGPHDVWSRRVGDVEVYVHMQHSEDADERSANEAIAQRYLRETAAYIRRYEPLIGRFPYERFTIVENFFSSGFAFPTMTLFGPMVMHMGDNAFRHGYLDHELLHSWWGCGIEVDRRDGNWCEGLASYGANYYGFVLDEDSEGARKKRRDQCNFLSRIKPEDDKPLGTYGLKDGAGRGIAYSKGSAVFHMLARRIGQERFWEAMRLFSERFIGRCANWEDLKALCEEAGEQNLDIFFDQWVRGGGAPALTLVAATYDPAGATLEIEIDQGDAAFVVDVPLRIYSDEGCDDVTVTISEPCQHVVIDVVDTPRVVELDPDYHVFRKLKPAQIMPTTATTKSARKLLIVVPPGEYREAYDTVAGDFKKAVEKKEHEAVTVVADDELTAETLAGGGVLVLGSAIRHPAVQELLARTECTVVWDDAGFAVGGQRFDGPNHAVLCTVHHPDLPETGISVYVGNSESALTNAGILGYYANSLLVFEANGRAKVVLRDDYESSERIDVATP